MSVVSELAAASKSFGQEDYVVGRPDRQGNRHPAGVLLPLANSVVLRNDRVHSADAALGYALGRWPITDYVYRRVRRISDRNVKVVIHNRPQALSSFKSPHGKILYLHNDVLTYLKMAKLRVLLDKAEAVITVSSWLADRYATRSGRLDIKSLINGVNVSSFRPRMGHLNETVPTIVFVGRVVEEKGVHVLIEACAKIRHLDFRLWVVGSQSLTLTAGLSDYEKRLRVLASSISDRVRFLPFTPRHELPALLRMGDIICVPSIWDEPCSLTLAEGMASGLAGVAASSGGLPEVAGNGASLVPPGDIDRLAAVLEYLISEPSALTEQKRSALSRSHELAWEVQHRKLMALLD